MQQSPENDRNPKTVTIGRGCDAQTVIGLKVRLSRDRPLVPNVRKETFSVTEQRKEFPAICRKHVSGACFSVVPVTTTSLSNVKNGLFFTPK